MEEEKEYNMLEEIYFAREMKVDEKISKKYNKYKINEKQIKVQDVIKNNENEKELLKLFDNLENHYNRKISFYRKGFYEEGFIDGVNLMIKYLEK